MKILVAVLTKNEAPHIRLCLESVAVLGCDILVVDSGSTDGTLEIAEEFGAEVATYEYVTEATTRNWILDNWGPRYEWLLFLDADERITPQLAEEIRNLGPPGPGRPVAYYIKRDMWFLGKPLRYGGHQDTYLLHLLYPPAARIVEQTRTLEYVSVDGTTGRLRGSIIHENKKPLTDWIRKHDFYAQREAEDRIRRVARKRPVTEGRVRAFIHNRVLSKMPPILFPLAFFSYRYFLRFGFLDGATGLVYYALHDIFYPALIAAKVIEIERSNGNRFAPERPFGEA